MVSPPPPRRLRRRCLSPVLGPVCQGPGPGSEEPAAAPAPRRRWQHPRSRRVPSGPVSRRRRPPHGGTPARFGRVGVGTPRRPAPPLSPAVGPPRRPAAPRSLRPALARSPDRHSPAHPSPTPGSLHDRRTTPARSASLPQPPRPQLSPSFLCPTGGALATVLCRPRPKCSAQGPGPGGLAWSLREPWVGVQVPVSRQGPREVGDEWRGLKEGILKLESLAGANQV